MTSSNPELSLNDPRKVAVVHSKLKIEWAKKHIEGVEAIVKLIAAETSNIVKSYQDTKTGRYKLGVGPKHDGFPAVLLLHIGDAVHNLNSITDFLWSGVARSIDPDLASKITFPRQDTRENLCSSLAAGRNAMIQKAFPQANSFVLDTVKPYQGSDRPFWTLNKLDNINKHRLLLLTTNIIDFRGGLVVRSQDGSVISFPAGAYIQTDGPNLTASFATPFEFNDDADPSIGVVFAENGLFFGEPIVETLVNLVEATTELIASFEEYFT